jgi:hypothetical protein
VVSICSAVVTLPPPLTWPSGASLLLLCALWEAVTLGAVLGAGRRPLVPLVLGRVADGTLLLSCVLLFFSLGGSFSTFGRGFIPDPEPAPAIAAAAGPTLSLAEARSQLARPAVRATLANKRFLGLRLDRVLVAGFAAAALLKGGLGLWLLAVSSGGRRLLGLGPLGLALHLLALLMGLG